MDEIMDEIIWNTEDLLCYCPKQVTEEASIYFKAAKNKIERIKFAADKIHKQPDLKSSDEFRELQLETEIYLESIAQNLHSLPDVLSHIITVLILRPLSELLGQEKLEPKGTKINIKNVLLLLRDNNSVETWKKESCKEIVDSIDELLGCNEYLYINAFVNTIKHRHLIDTEHRVRIDKNGKDDSWHIDEFERDGSVFASISHVKLTQDYQENIISLFCQIGEKINNYCRASFLSAVRSPIL
jgi:hypothetical protein